MKCVCCAELPTLRCTKTDVELLEAHWEQQPAAWRACLTAACRELQPLLPADEPGALHQRSLQVGDSSLVHVVCCQTCCLRTSQAPCTSAPCRCLVCVLTGQHAQLLQLSGCWTHVS